MPINIIKPDKRKPGKNGLRGRQGIQGVRGVQGVQGIAGANGKDGLNGLNGQNGVDGQDGSKWYNGKGAPDATLGATGDFYLDNDTYDYFEKTTRWVKRGNLKGAKGDKGDRGEKGANGKDGGVGTPGADGAQGPQGLQGPQGIQGIPGAGGVDDKNYVQVFTNESTITVTHNLGKYPATTITDSTGDEVLGNVIHNSVNELVATFSASFTGKIICN